MMNSRFSNFLLFNITFILKILSKKARIFLNASDLFNELSFDSLGLDQIIQSLKNPKQVRILFFNIYLSSFYFFFLKITKSNCSFLNSEISIPEFKQNVFDLFTVILPSDFPSTQRASNLLGILSEKHVFAIGVSGAGKVLQS